MDKVNWHDYLDPRVTYGDLLSGRFEEEPPDLVLAHDGVDLCFCDPEFEPEEETSGTPAQFLCRVVYLACYLGDFRCWWPLDSTGTYKAVNAVKGRVLAMIKRRTA